MRPIFSRVLSKSSPGILKVAEEISPRPSAKLMSQSVRIPPICSQRRYLKCDRCRAVAYGARSRVATTAVGALNASVSVIAEWRLWLERHRVRDRLRTARQPPQRISVKSGGDAPLPGHRQVLSTGSQAA